eukprot:scaffold7007_cov69-Cyclotella_meneghiniana.AAC.1
MTMWDVIRATLQEHHQRIVKANQAKRRLDQMEIANGKEEASEHQGGAVEGEGAAINHDSSVINDNLKAPTGIDLRGPDYSSVAAAPKHAAAHLKDPPHHHEVMAASTTENLTGNAESTANNDQGPNLATTWNTAVSSSRKHQNKKNEESNLVTTVRATVKSSDFDASIPSQLKATKGVSSASEPDAPFSTAASFHSGETMNTPNDVKTKPNDLPSHELSGFRACLTMKAKSPATNDEGINLLTTLSTVKSPNLSNQIKKDGESVHDLNTSKPEKPVAKNTLQDQGVNGRPLCAPNDSSHLSPLHCYIRQHCLEYVIASFPNTKRLKRLKPVHVGMVGLQCVFCKNEEERAAASVSFPGSVDKIISSVLMWLYRHVPKCQHIPKDIKKKVKKFRESEINSGLPYIIETARETGLVDMNEGIYVQGSGMVNNAVELMKGDLADDQNVVASSGTSLIGASDKRRNANTKTDASYVKTKSGKHKRLCKVAGCEKQGRRYRDDMCRHHYRIMTGEVQPWKPKRKREEYEVTNDSASGKKAKVDKVLKTSSPEEIELKSISEDDVPANLELPTKMDQRTYPISNGSVGEVPVKPAVKLTYSSAIEYIRNTNITKSTVAVGE